MPAAVESSMTLRISSPAKEPIFLIDCLSGVEICWNGHDGLGDSMIEKSLGGILEYF
jgi:hypothetical protein